MTLNLWLYLIMGVATGFGACMNSDEAAKYITPECLFWIRTGVSTLNGVALTMKGLTSNSFAEWMARKNGNGHTPQKP